MCWTWSIYRYKKSTIRLHILRLLYDGKVIFNIIPLTKIKIDEGFSQGKSVCWGQIHLPQWIVNSPKNTIKQKTLGPTCNTCSSKFLIEYKRAFFFIFFSQFFLFVYVVYLSSMFKVIRKNNLSRAFFLFLFFTIYM